MIYLAVFTPIVDSLSATVPETWSYVRIITPVLQDILESAKS